MGLTVLIFLMMLSQADAADLVPGTTSTYTEGGYTWAGNPECYSTGFLLQPTSPAVDAGAIIEGLDCPASGPSSQFPLNADGSPCNEWYGAAPDIGACEYVSGAPTPPVAAVVATLLGQTGEDIAGASAEGADGIPDVHIRLTNVPSSITHVIINGEQSGTWETPLACCWIVAVKPTPDASIVDLYFNFWRDNASYTLNLTFANGASQTVTTIAPAIVPTVPTAPTLSIH